MARDIRCPSNGSARCHERRCVICLCFMEVYFYSHTKLTVNRVLRRHNDAVYYPLAIRAVAQQIDQLYWDSAADGSTEYGADGAEDSDVGRIDDLTRDEYVKGFFVRHSSLFASNTTSGSSPSCQIHGKTLQSTQNSYAGCISCPNVDKSFKTSWLLIGSYNL